MARCEQVGELVHEHVVDDKGRHPPQSRRQPDRALGGRARPPARYLVGHPPHAHRPGSAVEEFLGQRRRPLRQLAVTADGAPGSATLLVREPLHHHGDPFALVSPRHPSRQQHDGAVAVAVGGDGAAPSCASAHLDERVFGGHVRTLPGAGHRFSTTHAGCARDFFSSTGRLIGPSRARSLPVGAGGRRPQPYTTPRTGTPRFVPTMPTALSTGRARGSLTPGPVAHNVVPVEALDRVAVGKGKANGATGRGLRHCRHCIRCTEQPASAVSDLLGAPLAKRDSAHAQAPRA
jgi:hypothetical protein